MPCDQYYDHDIDVDMGLSDPITTKPFDLEWFEAELDHTELLQLDGYLNLAVEHNCPYEAIELLLEAGADPNGEEWATESPLSMASSKGNTTIVDLLLRCGANPKLATSSGEELQDEVIELLERK